MEKKASAPTTSAIFSKVGESVTKLGANIKANLTSAGSMIQSKIQETSMVLTENESHFYQELWEQNENCPNCRSCKAPFIAPIRTKHHCRHCASLYCIDCLILTEVNENSVSKAAGKITETSSCEIKICLGCLRGESPGPEIREHVLSALQAAIKKKTKRPNTLTEAREKAATKGNNASAQFHEAAAAQAKQKHLDAQPKEKSALEKFGYSIGDSLGVLGPSEEQASSQLPLGRGVLYGKGIGETPPICGYFEFTNKSSQVCCIKLLVRGGNTLFEVPRPSYWAIPPHETVNATFEGSQQQLELLVLFNNPVSPEGSMVFDTRARGWGGAPSPDKISPCAQVGKFLSYKMFKLNCENANCLLKYKGNGVVETRRGDGVGRIGLFAKLSGKRWAKGEIDYNTNISSVFEMKL